MPILTLSPDELAALRQALPDYSERLHADALALESTRRAPTVVGILRRMASTIADVHAKVQRL